MIVAGAILLISMLPGFWRIARGPTVADRLVGVQMTGTASIALLLIMAQSLDEAALRDVAIVLALLAAAIGAALVQILRRPEQRRGEDAA